MDINFSSTNLKLTGLTDKLFENGPYPKPFEFNQEVANVFDDMVSRSVPLYREVIIACIQWAHYFAKPNTNLYDIGCSTGTTLDAISQVLKFPINLIGIDNSQSMIEKAKEKLKSQTLHSIHLECKDIISAEFENASFIIMNYTLQFIPVIERKKVLSAIFQGLNKNGILFLSEKVRSNCPEIQETMTKNYENFKVHAGYSKTEIERKKEALDHVLISQTNEELTTMLHDVGFAHTETIMRWNNFNTIVAIKK